MLVAIRGRFLQHTHLSSLLPTFFLVLLLPIISACGSSSSSDSALAPADSANPISVTQGDGAITVSNSSAGTARSTAQEACTYNVYIASQAGVTNENYQSLPDGAWYENVTFPFTITGLDNDKTYYIAVYQVCGGAETQVGSEVSVTPLSAPTSGGSSGTTPEPVDVTRVDAGVESVTVQWRSPSDFKALTSADYSTGGYTVCYQAGSSIGNGATCVEDVWRGKTAYNFTGLTGGQQYCFGVKQWKEEIGLSQFGTTMCTMPTSPPATTPAPTPTPAPTAPNAPTGVTATAGDTQVTVSWTASAGATSYNVYYSTTTGVNKSNGTLVTGATSGSAITGLTNGTTYYFVVTAVNANGESAESGEVNATPTGGGIPTGMVSVTGGCYQAGDNFAEGSADELPVHQVCLSNFSIDKTEVTQGQYLAVIGSSPSNFTACGADCPVEMVNHTEATAYCTAVGKRLPTEAEWEYAARQGGQVVRYGTGKDTISTAEANYNNTPGTTVTVGSYAPNSLGLYDMSGNVWEWVSDWYSGTYYTDGFPADVNDPQGPGSGSSRVVRGGSWIGTSGNLRASSLTSLTPSGRTVAVGFRCAQ